jgi:hypothetical protein
MFVDAAADPPEQVAVGMCVVMIRGEIGCSWIVDGATSLHAMTGDAVLGLRTRKANMRRGLLTSIATVALWPSVGLVPVVAQTNNGFVSGHVIKID